MREGAIKLRILPVNRKDCFAFKLFAKDGKVAGCVNKADMTMVLRAVLVTMPRSSTVATDEVVVGVGGYDGDAGCYGGHRGCRTFTIMCSKVGRGRSGCMCNTCSAGDSRRMSTL
jgi:hypothetical protein